MEAGHSYIIHKHGFLCATEGAELSIGFQRKLGAELFGSNGFILQQLRPLHGLCRIGRGMRDLRSQGG